MNQSAALPGKLGARTKSLLSAVLAIAGTWTLASCQDGSTEATLNEAVASITKTAGPAGWQAVTYPTNNSQIEIVNSTPVDYTGSLTKRTTATVIYLSGVADQANLEVHCTEAISYLKQVQKHARITWQGSSLTEQTCLSNLTGTSQLDAWNASADGIDYTARIEAATNGSKAAVAVLVRAHLNSNS